VEERSQKKKKRETVSSSRKKKRGREENLNSEEKGRKGLANTEGDIWGKAFNCGKGGGLPGRGGDFLGERGGALT